jgi:hypothetical protein
LRAAPPSAILDATRSNAAPRAPSTFVPAVLALQEHAPFIVSAVRVLPSPVLSRACAAALVAWLLSAVPDAAHAQTLRGSRASVARVHDYAVAAGLRFHRTPTGVRRAAKAGRFTRLRSTRNYRLAGVSFPYVRPTTKRFVDDLAGRYRRACGRRLVVTSATRPTSRQPRNGSPRSVHPAGIAVDLRRPSGRCLTWLRRELIVLERAGLIDATEERRPAHLHVAVLTKRYQRFAEGRAGSPHAKSARSVAYTVRAGDTLSELAERSHTSVARLRALNGLRSSDLRRGQRLRLPAAR